MGFKFLRGTGGDRLREIETKVQLMAAYGRQEFDLAISALYGERVAAPFNDELRRIDRKVNRLEREIRRELLVHSSVFGGIETPAVLVFMSIVKDMERVGDYAKNLLDLALDGANLAELPDAEEWRRLTADISSYITEAGASFGDRDEQRCRALSERGHVLLGFFDDAVSALVRGTDRRPQPVARALAYRYLKRVVAHLMNVLSAVIVPLDRLDHIGEDPEDRAGR